MLFYLLDVLFSIQEVDGFGHFPYVNIAATYTFRRQNEPWMVYIGLTCTIDFTLPSGLSSSMIRIV